MTTNAYAFEPFVVKKIQITGLVRVSEDAVLQSMNVRVGDTLKSKDTSPLINSLYGTGFFNDVKLSKANSATLVVELVERPSIGKFNLKGIKKDKKIEAILKEHDIVEGRIYNPSAMAKAEEEIYNHFLVRGNYNVKVKSKTKQSKDHLVDVTLSVYKGDEAKISSINIIGNTAYTKKEITKQMFHSETGAFSWFKKDNVYAKEKLAADLENIRSFYSNNGFFKFKINSTQVSLSKDKRHVYLMINLTEGDRYSFGNIAIEGDMVVEKSKIHDLVGEFIKEGQVFNESHLRSAKTALDELMGSEGYSNADVRANWQVDDENKLVSVKFYIKSNNKVTVRRIEIVGNGLTDDAVLRRGLPQLEATTISTNNVKLGKEFMQRKGYASQVDIKTTPVPGVKDQVDIEYKIEEQRLQSFNAQIAYSGSDQFMFTLGADFKNFLGSGKDFSFNFDNSRTSTVYSLGFFDPDFFGSNVGMGYNIYKRKVNLSQTSDIFDYTTSSWGGNVYWSWPINPYSDVSISFGYDDTILDLHEDCAPEEVHEFLNSHNNKTKYQEFTMAFGWARNNTDAFLFPTKGSKQNFSMKASVPGSDIEYVKFDYKISYYKPLYEDKYIFNFASELGYGTTYNGGQYPFYRHYYMGGAESLRGFDEKALGPVSTPSQRNGKGGDQRFGGNASVLLRGSIIFPPPLFEDTKNVRTSLFLDAGQVYDTNNKRRHDGDSRSPTGFRYSVGLSLLWNSPLGVPLSFSLAKPLNAKEDEGVRFFAFTFGTRF